MRHPTLTLPLALMLATAAQAHVTLPPGGGAAGTVYTAAFRVGHACSKEATATTGLTVRLPAGFTLIDAEPREHWALKSSPSEVSWTAQRPEAAVPNAEKTTFVLRGKLPDQPGLLYFKVLQRCDIGQADWAEIPAHAADKPAMPAARLEVLPSGGAAPAEAATAHAH
ncbi:DUF1775 domain-containing protein [Roseateles sp. BYS180W]|uniref:DUF1775 domain-containing protein n=1 Tax=Roseateles rivi TaxID=3299028 RepID=A0ABW7FX46_9BURK